MKNDIFCERMNARYKELKSKQKLTQKGIAHRIWQEEIDKEKTEELKNAALESKRKALFSYLHNNVHPEKHETYLRICQVLDCDLEYLFGLQDQPRRSTKDIEALTHLSMLASDELRIAADSYNEEVNDDLVKSTEFHEYVVGKKAKILFLQHLLENSDLWEIISVSYFDYLNEMKKAEISPYTTVNDFTHSQIAEIYVSKAQTELRKLFEMKGEDTIG